MIRSGNIEGSGWGDPESRLPATRPLTLTRNFIWVVVFCMVSLQIVPVAIAWAASMFLK